jgi:peptidoglycan/LPS O-acetylase OafA/YrhL
MNRYFPALDVLRLIAATLVMVGHVELILNYRWMEGFMSASLVHESGKAGVAIFFALSGFLLAKIAMEEKESKDGFCIKQFVKKRALRILPLYYFIMIVAFFFLAKSNVFYVENQTEELRLLFVQKLLLYVALLPQLNDVFFNEKVSTVLQFWTIGSEVIFYLILPFLIRAKKPLKAMITAFIAFTILKYSLQLLVGKTPFEGIVSTLYYIMLFNRIECLLLGAIAAVLMHQKHKWAVSLASKDNMIFGTGLIVLMLIMHRRIITGFDYALYTAAIIPFLLYFTAPERKPSNSKLMKLLTYGGKISYSIYLTHIIVLMAVWYFIYEYTLLAENSFTIAFYAVGMVAVYAVSAITYRFIELPFLNMKKKSSDKK